MAERVEAPAVTVTAGTAIATPQITDISIPPGEVEGVEVFIPPGPAGLVGFALDQAGNQAIPRVLGQWIVRDNDVIRWPLSGFLNSGSWQFRAYNTDIYDHTLYVVFLVSEIVIAAVIAPPPIAMPLPL